VKSVPVELLKELAAINGENRLPFVKDRKPFAFDLDDWIARSGLELDGPKEWQGGRRWVFDICPWNPEHCDRSAFICQNAEGAISAGCHHNGCREKNWHSLRAVVERESHFDVGGARNAVAESDRKPWTTPIRFSQFVLPAFPTDALPSWLKAFVSALANATQTPPDLAGMLTLSVIAAACAKKVSVQLKDGFVEPANIFTVTALPPGNRKTAVFSAAVKPLEQHELSEAKRSAGEIAKKQSDHKIKESTLKRLQERAAAATAKNQEAIAHQASELAAELSAIHVGVPTRLIADDCTPEKLQSLLRDQGGRIAVLSPEGDVFDLMAGRYSAHGVGNFGVYLRGHAGDNLRVDRVGRAPDSVVAPALTMGLAVQPEVIQGLASKPGFRGRGLLGRFLYSLPKSLLGTRDTNPAPVPPNVRTAYVDYVLAILRLPFGQDDSGQPCPHTVTLDPEANLRFRTFEAWVEPQLSEFGPLGGFTDWAGKLVGAVGRLGLLLHMAEHADADEPWAFPISKETIEKAIRIGEYLIPHAKAAYAEMGADVVVEQAKRILRWINHFRLESFSKRDLHQALRGSIDFKRVSELDAPLAVLVTHGYVREQQADSGAPGAGRRPSPRYEVNPLRTRPANNAVPGSNSEDIEHFEDLPVQKLLDR
jgi:hypothetical protein